MSTKATGYLLHLTLADRAAIEHGISRGVNFTQIACRINKDSSYHFQGDSASPFPGSSFSKRNPAEALRMRAFSELCKAANLRESDCNSLCWNAALSAVPCMVLTLLPDSAKS